MTARAGVVMGVVLAGIAISVVLVGVAMRRWGLFMGVQKAEESSAMGGVSDVRLGDDVFA
jgi:hypothetical protein